MDTDDLGIIYVATGDKFIQEAVNSARSVERFLPGIRKTLFTDNGLANRNALFDCIEVIEYPSYSYLDKIESIRRSPYKRSLFLDTDTELIDSCMELFELLDRFDVAAAHGSYRWILKSNFPDSFPALNTGVILFNNTPVVQDLFKSWRDIHQKNLKRPDEFIPDDPAFQEALYHSGVRFSVLAPEYNLRTPFPYFIGGRAGVKILHGRSPSISIVKMRRQRLQYNTHPRIGGGKFMWAKMTAYRMKKRISTITHWFRKQKSR